jgi:hypothetical protein
MDPRTGMDAKEKEKLVPAGNRIPADYPVSTSAELCVEQPRDHREYLQFPCNTFPKTYFIQNIIFYDELF